MILSIANRLVLFLINPYSSQCSRAMKMQVSNAGVSFWRRHICIQPIPNNECTINRTKTNRLRLATHLFAHVRARSLVLVTIGWICINFSIKIIQVYERFEERCMVSARFELDTLNSSDMQKYIYIYMHNALHAQNKMFAIMIISHNRDSRTNLMKSNMTKDKVNLH